MINSPQSTFYFWFSSFYQYWYMKNQFGPLWPIFGLMMSSRRVKTSWFWDTLPQISLYYWLSSFYHHCYVKYRFRPFFDPMWLNGVTTWVKTAILWESDLRNKLLTSKFHQMLILIFLWPLIHDIQLWALFPKLEIMAS